MGNSSHYTEEAIGSMTSQLAGVEIFCFATTSETAMVPNQPPIQWAMGNLF